MGKDYLIDSNVLRKYIEDELSIRGNELLDSLFNLKTCNICFINRIELLSWNPEQSLRNLVLEFIDLSFEFPLTEEIILKTIEIRKKVKIKLPDAIIAATAMVHDLILLSDNDKDFGKVPNLKYLNPRKYK